MKWSLREKVPGEVLICTLALMIFSFFIHAGFPGLLLSAGALILAAFIIAGNIRNLSGIRNYTGELNLLKIPVIYTIASLLAGLLLSVLYRYHLDFSLLPESIHGFAFIAAIIGISEELVFRGFIQGHLRQISIPASIIAGSLSHTGYKCCLFLSPYTSGNINIWFLAFWTFSAGILLGIFRQKSDSVVPSALAHGLFDIMAYAGAATAPWWVW